MKNEINAVLENMTTTIPEPEDYTGEDGLLYCGKCRKPKEAYFAPDKAAIFGRDRHPAECDCQRAARGWNGKPPKSGADTLTPWRNLKRRGFTDPAMRDWTFENDNGRNPQTAACPVRYVEHWDSYASREYRLPVLGRCWNRQKLPCGLYRKRPHGERNPRPHDELCSLSSMTLPPALRGTTSTFPAFAAIRC